MSGAVDVMVGDVWRYDERSADWDLVGEMREVASVREECGELYFRDKHGAGADVKFLVEHATLVSRAGQPVTAEHDRSGCAAFCGLRYSDSCFPTCGCFDWAHCTHAFFEDTIDDPIGWCSARCRDLRLPPMGERAAKEAADAIVGKILDLVDASMSAEAAVRKSAPVKRPAGITCNRCLVTSEHGDQHLETCTTSDFAPSDRDLTSEEWSAQVHYELLRLEGEREDAARPFVPDISDEELFGRPVR